MTYYLQADNNADFSSPEVDVSGLSQSNYTPESALSEGNHYWRVKVVDGAGNQSAWTTARSLAVGAILPVGGEEVAGFGGQTTWLLVLAGGLVFLLTPVFIIQVRRRQQARAWLNKVQQHLQQLEEEGYDMSDFRKKWLE